MQLSLLRAATLNEQFQFAGIEPGAMAVDAMIDLDPVEFDDDQRLTTGGTITPDLQGVTSLQRSLTRSDLPTSRKLAVVARSLAAPAWRKAESTTERKKWKKKTRPEGLEPPTFRFEACHSIQLSYGRFVT